MDFKKWFYEIAHNFGLPATLERPDLIAANNAKKGLGAFPSYDSKPLPGNKKPMKKKAKKK